MNSVLQLPTKSSQYSDGQTLCRDCLLSGRVDSFLEMFNLMILSRNRRKEAEEREDRCLPVLLETQRPKLKLIHQAFAECERTSTSQEKEYERRMKLGQLFEERQEDHWLSEYFYLSGYRSICNANTQDGKKMIEMLQRLGFMKEKKGALSDALDLLEEAFALAVDRGLEMTDGMRKSLYLITFRICITMGDKSFEKEQHMMHVKKLDIHHSETLKLYKKALAMAELAETKESIAAAHAKIGRVLLFLRSDQLAMKHFVLFLEICHELQDSVGLCSGYLAISAAYESMNNHEMMRSVLEECKAIALENNYAHALVPCCIVMGQMETYNDNYEEAYEEFQMAYKILKENETKFANYRDIAKLVRVLVGIGRAHLHYGRYTSILSENVSKSLFRLIDWKVTGTGFDIQEPVPTADTNT